MAEKCYQVACMGKELTVWDEVQAFLYFFGPAFILIFIMIALAVWIVKK